VSHREGPVSETVLTAVDRADRVVARVLGVGRRRARQLIASGEVLIDGHRVRSGERITTDAAIAVLRSADERPTEPTPPMERPRIVWQQGHVIAVNKPSGYHSHRGEQRPSIADFLADLYPGIEDVGESGMECGVAHRLDRDTSGILLAASNARVFAELRAAFANGEISKDYLALVHGAVMEERIVDIPLARLRSRVRVARRGERSWPARTRIVPLERGPGWTLVRATMETGVTHQVRAHLAILGCPVIGDRTYADAAGGRDFPGGQRLHASCIRLPWALTLAAAAGRLFLETLAELRRGTDFSSR